MTQHKLHQFQEDSPFPAAFAAPFGHATGAVFDVALRDPKAQPLGGVIDLNMLRTKIPQVLLDALEDPYRRPTPATCAGIACISSDENKGAVKMVKIDVDKNPAVFSQIARMTGSQSIPTVVAFKNGQPVDVFMGALPESQVRAFITARGGTTVTAGLPNPSAKWDLQAVSLIAEERTLKGSYVGSCVPARDVPRYVIPHRTCWCCSVAFSWRWMRRPIARACSSWCRRRGGTMHAR